MKRQVMPGQRVCGVDWQGEYTKKERKVLKLMKKLKRMGYTLPEFSYPNADAYDELKDYVESVR